MIFFSLFISFPLLQRLNFWGKTQLKIRNNKTKIIIKTKRKLIIFLASETFKDLLKKHRTKRSTDQLIESPDYICERFKTPTPDKTFFSPIHQSSTYPSNVDCVLKLVGMVHANTMLLMLLFNGKSFILN